MELNKNIKEEDKKFLRKLAKDIIVEYGETKECKELGVYLKYLENHIHTEIEYAVRNGEDLQYYLGAKWILDKIKNKIGG